MGEVAPVPESAGSAVPVPGTVSVVMPGTVADGSVVALVVVSGGIGAGASLRLITLPTSHRTSPTPASASTMIARVRDGI